MSARKSVLDTVGFFFSGEEDEKKISELAKLKPAQKRGAG